MKQVLQSLKTGATEVAEVPCPSAKRGHVLVRTTNTLVSAGTERMLVQFGRAGWISKALQQPDKVRAAIDKIRTDGLVPTIEAVFNKVDQPLPLGYCNVGTVMEVGPGVSGYAAGDRVASNGRHAEVVSVPTNLCAKIPASVTDEEATFTVLGAIALQGIRLAQPTLGETVVVTGLGLIGLMTVQLLRAHGCRVLGLDFDPDRLALARSYGAETVDLAAGQDPVAAAHVYSRGHGVDAVLITASTDSDEPLHQAALMCRKRGRIVLVGVAGSRFSRADFYEKELSFQVSCSYGPGRYDPRYEEQGVDYPIGYVRWTEQRNLEAVLDMMADRRLDTKPLISHRFAIDEAGDAYRLLVGEARSLGVLLQYPLRSERPDDVVRQSNVTLNRNTATGTSERPALGFVGSGNYSTSVLIPVLKATGARLKTIASRTGVTGLHAGAKFGFESTTTNLDELWTDKELDAVVIATRHDSHAQLVCTALAAGKHVFVEKPLCLDFDELAEIETAQARSGKMVMVGFNRRFAPHVKKIKDLLAGVTGPKSLIMTVNSGAIPAEHWTQDLEAGGGRIIGEACHFIDLLRFLAGASITRHDVFRMESVAGDTVTITLRFADGSIGTVHYFANGDKAFPKERLEVFAAGRILQLDNFRKLRGYGWPNLTTMNLWRQDKGQRDCAAAFVASLATGESAPIPFAELVEVARLSIQVAEAAR